MIKDINKIFDDWDEEEFYDEPVKFDIDIEQWTNYANGIGTITGNWVIYGSCDPASSYETITITTNSTTASTINDYISSSFTADTWTP